MHQGSIFPTIVQVDQKQVGRGQDFYLDFLTSHTLLTPKKRGRGKKKLPFKRPL